MCHENRLVDLPDIPESLTSIWCYKNKLAKLPSLSTGLRELFCHRNNLTVLPPLPASLEMLTCHDNQLTALPPLPDGLKKLDCSNNQLTELPELPDSLTELLCSGNMFPDRNEGESIAEFAERLVQIASRKRMTERSRTIKEDLMIYCWNTGRLLRIMKCYPTNQWNHELQKYGDLDFITADEIF
jgi:hypothetical protein